MTALLTECFVTLGYRLHLAAETPDFVLRVTPSSLSFLPGEVVSVTVYVLRKDGFDGEIGPPYSGVCSLFGPIMTL